MEISDLQRLARSGETSPGQTLFMDSSDPQRMVRVQAPPADVTDNTVISCGIKRCHGLLTGDGKCWLGADVARFSATPPRSGTVLRPMAQRGRSHLDALKDTLNHPAMHEKVATAVEFETFEGGIAARKAYRTNKCTGERATSSDVFDGPRDNYANYSKHAFRLACWARSTDRLDMAQLSLHSSRVCWPT